MQNVEFEKDNPAVLICPECGSSNLHHDAVTVYERDKEDTPSQALVIRDRAVTRVEDPHAGQNPSLRRNGVAVRFWCECCTAISELTLAQHKGASLLEWRPYGRSLLQEYRNASSTFSTADVFTPRVPWLVGDLVNGRRNP